MTKSIKSLKTVGQQIDANTLASEDLMSLPTMITSGSTEGLFVPQLEAELIAA